MNGETRASDTAIIVGQEQHGGHDACGCCDGRSVATPLALWNRPALDEIAYRVGTHARFKESLLARLAAASPKELAPLAELGTRDQSDFTIALLDAWAAALDVLTFYQERIANESYLRTATERLSILELARLIGYRPRPGAAASAWLAFTLESAPGAPEQAPARVVVPRGTRVQSIPGPGERPQTFETSSDLDAAVATNAIRPRRSAPSPLRENATEAWLAGTATRLQIGDAVLLVAEQGAKVHWFAALLTVVEPDVAGARTRIAWVPALSPREESIDKDPPRTFVGPDIDVPAVGTAVLWGAGATASSTYDSLASSANELAAFNSRMDRAADSSSRASTSVPSRFPEKKAATEDPERSTREFGVFALRVRAALFGHNAPNPHALHAETALAYWKSKGYELPDPLKLDAKDWPFLLAERAIDLDARYAGISPGSWAVLGNEAVSRIYWVRVAMDAAREDYVLSGKCTRLIIDRSIGPDTVAVASYRRSAVYAGSELLALADAPIIDPVQGSVIDVEGDFGTLEPMRRIIVRGRRARVEVLGPLGDVAGARKVSSDPAAPKVGAVLTLVESPSSSAVPLTSTSEDFRWRLRDALGIEWQAIARASAFRYVAAAKDGEVVAEIATLVRVERLDGRHTRLHLAAPLSHAYDRISLEPPAPTVILANVVLATHGETVSERLGSGHAGRSFERFRLRQTPVTYVGSSSPDGVESTLELRVDDVLWKEAPYFHGRAADERIFVTETADDGATSVIFGDGQTGSRLPSGQENLSAVYRKGIGRAGNVGSGQLSLLATRPSGVKEVVNPLAATGGADPESRDSARQSAPLPILALGRVVSLRDFEDFARSFGGGVIAKALATWIWDGLSRRVLLTVAGPGGAAIPADDPVHQRLVDALRGAGDPFVPFSVLGYRAATFRLALRVRVDPDYLASKVLPSVELALRQRFSFELRSFGEAATLGEVLAAAHGIPGVVAVDVDAFYRGTAPDVATLPPARILAATAGVVEVLEGTLKKRIVESAELLTLDAAPLDRLEELG
jgi:hypothetical protein